jgi:hypothetical protein
MHCKVPLGAYCEVHVDPDITNTMEPEDEMRNMSWAYWEHARKLQILITLNRKEGHSKEVHRDAND